ncbi:MAG: hypothetical protein QGI33_05745 [Candidatus Brocadiia bacterium]|nr:hypothetical protein [Candidatus Brocadiia bacterium]
MSAAEIFGVVVGGVSIVMLIGVLRLLQRVYQVVRREPPKGD